MITDNKLIEKYSPCDGDFYLIKREDGRLLAKAYGMDDARLIAAAPDLLAAVYAFLDAYSCIEGETPAAVRNAARTARAAIAKATGN